VQARDEFERLGRQDLREFGRDAAADRDAVGGFLLAEGGCLHRSIL
jgi:hypothetical protein